MRNHVAHAEIITADAVIPIFLQIFRQGLGFKIDIEIVRSVKGISADKLHRRRQIEAGKRFCHIEGISADKGRPLGNCQRLQAFGIAERIIVDVLDLCVPEIDTPQIFHPFEAVRLNGSQRRTGFEGNRSQTVAASEHVRRNAFHPAAGGKSDVFQPVASLKCVLRNRIDTCGNAERIDSRIGKRGIAYPGQLAVFRKVDGREPIIVCKGIVADLYHVIGNIDRRQIRDVVERIGFDIRQAFRHIYVRKIMRPVKSRFIDDLRSPEDLISGSGVSGRIHDRRFLVYGIYNPGNVRIIFIAFRHFDRLQIMTGRKDAEAEIIYPCGDRHRARKTAETERIIADLQKRFGKGYLTQRISISECLPSDILQIAVFGKRHRLQAVIAGESAAAHRHQRTGKGKALYVALEEYVIPYLHQTAVFRKVDLPDTRIGKRPFPYHLYICGNIQRFQCKIVHEGVFRNDIHAAAERKLPQIVVVGKGVLVEKRHAVGDRQTFERRIGKRIPAYALHAVQIDFCQFCVSESIRPYLRYGIGQTVLSAQSGGICDQRSRRPIKQDAAAGDKVFVARRHAERAQGIRPEKCRSVQITHVFRNVEARQTSAVCKRHIADRRQRNILRPDHFGEPRVIIKCLRADRFHAVRNFDARQFRTTAERCQADIRQSVRQIDLPQARLPFKGKIAYGRDDPPFDPLGNRYVSSVPRIGSDLHRSVVENHIGVRNAVVFVYPSGIQRNVRCKYVRVPIQFFGAVNVIIPAVKYGIVSLRLGKILQRMIADKYLFDVLHLIGEHIESHFAPFFADERVDVESAVTEKPILSDAPQIRRRRIQQFDDVCLFHIIRLIFQKGQSARDDGRRERRPVDRSVRTSRLRRVNRPRRNDIRIFAVIGIPCQLKTVCGKRPYPDDVFIRRRIHQRRRAVVARRGDADDIAFHRKLGGGGIGVSAITAEGHIDDVNIPFDGIVHAEHQIGSAIKHAVRRAFCLDDEQRDFRRHADRTLPVHSCADRTGNGGTMSLFIVDQRPIVIVIFHHFVFRGIIRIFADPPRKFGMIIIDARIDYSHRNAVAAITVPGISDIQIIEITLILIIGIAHRIIRSGRDSLSRNRVGNV